jgi:peptidyl-prolyl cis-trans isomerase SurA
MLIHKELKGTMHSFRRLAAAFAIPAVLIAATLASADVIEAVLVKVNGEILTKTDLEQRQVQALRQRGIQPGDDAALKKAIADITPQLLVETIDEMLLIQRGKELGYTMSDEEFNRVVTRIRTDNKLETDEAFEAALKQEGMTMSDLRASLEKQMLVTRVQQAEVLGKISISEEEARKYHAEHVDTFTQRGQVTIREILVGIPKSEKGLNMALDDEARAKAEAARKRIAGGEAFEQVAAEVSTSTSSANGGLVGPLNPAELTPAFQELLKGLKPGDVSEVTRTPAGYQIVKLESQTPDKVLTPEEARDRIGDILFEQKRQAEFKKYLEKQRAQAIIEWKNEEIRKAWLSRVQPQTAAPAETAPAESAPATPPAKPAPPGAPPAR